jgi:hypothetical protein
MRKCTKARVLPLHTLKNIFKKKLDSGGLEVCANAAKLVFNHFRR